jgi:hypothetical protein
MIKFSRSYDRSVLIYREAGHQGRILLRLGRTFEDGECKADDPKSIPEQFELLTYIVAKDPEALIDDIANRFSEYLDDGTNLAFRSVVFDALKLQDHISREMSAPGGSELLRSLDVIYGKQVMEILFAATFGEDGRRHGKRLQSAKKKKNPDQGLPKAAIGLAGFVTILAVPVAATLIFRPEIYESFHTPSTGGSVILNYASKIDRSLASAQIVDEDVEDIFAQARQRKQDLFLVSGLGTLTEDYEYLREITIAGNSREGSVKEDSSDDEQELVKSSDAAASEQSEPSNTDADTEGPTPSDDVAENEGRTVATDTDEADSRQTDIQSSANALLGALKLSSISDGSIASQKASQPQGSLLQALDKVLASSPVLDASLASAAEVDEADTVQTQYDIPVEIAKFKIKAFRTFEDEDLQTGNVTAGATATYDVARRPETIFEVVRGDLSGLGRSLDDQVMKICGVLEASKDDPVQFTTANLSFDLGSSPFMATVIDAEVCDEGTYAIWPMFNLELSLEQDDL